MERRWVWAKAGILFTLLVFLVEYVFYQTGLITKLPFVSFQYIGGDFPTPTLFGYAVSAWFQILNILGFVVGVMGIIFLKDTRWRWFGVVVLVALGMLMLSILPHLPIYFPG